MRARLNAGTSSTVAAALSEPRRRGTVEREVNNFIAAKPVVTLDHDVWGHQVFTTPEILRVS